MIVYRVQDADGRGPFKPGQSHRWLDAIDCRRHEEFPSWIDEFGIDAIIGAKEKGLHVGSACRSIDALKQWFSRTERRRLKKLGYQPVSMVADVILGESKIQLLIGRNTPLSEDVTVVRWSQ